jgi:hypothetical protein
MSAPLPEWEVLCVSQGKGGQYYMELCNGEGVRREPITAHDAAVIITQRAQGVPLYAKFPKPEEAA